MDEKKIEPQGNDPVANPITAEPQLDGDNDCVTICKQFLVKSALIGFAGSVLVTTGYHFLIGKNFATQTDLKEANDKLTKLNTLLVQEKSISKSAFKQEGYTPAVKALINSRNQLSRSVHAAAAERTLKTNVQNSSTPIYDGGHVVTKVETYDN